MSLQTASPISPHSQELRQVIRDQSQSSPAEGRPKGLGLTATLVTLHEGRTMVEDPRQGVLDAPCR
jgi:hypothetical protein